MCSLYFCRYVCNAHNAIIDVTLVRLSLVKLKTP